MKKIIQLICFALAFCFLLCACDNAAADYSDADGNSELITMENKKISGDDIGVSVISVESKDKNKIKVFKTEFVDSDFSFEFKKLKVSGFAYVSEDEKTPQYPEKISLPEYDLTVFKEIMLTAYEQKFGALPEEGTFFVSEPQFSTRNFTGRLVVTYIVYTDPTADGLGISCYGEARRVTMTADLYTYEVAE